MAILLMQDMATLKELVSKYGYTVHIHDACGAQSFTLEPVSDNPDEQVYKAIDEFFSEHKMSYKFYDAEKLNFVAK